MTEFPLNPFAILDPNIRWALSQQDLKEKSYEQQIPPLVCKIRLAVKEWRDSDYADASETTRGLLQFWFKQNPLIPDNGYDDLDWQNDFHLTLQIDNTATTKHNNGAIFVQTVCDYPLVEAIKPLVADNQPYLFPKKSVFNKIIGDSHFELEFAAFLENCGGIVSFAKNYYQPLGFKIEYQGEDGNIQASGMFTLPKPKAGKIWMMFGK